VFNLGRHEELLYKMKKATVNVVAGLLNLSTLMMEPIRSSEMYVVTKARRHHVPEDSIFPSHRRVNVPYYIPLTGWAFFIVTTVKP
jgi:hypothetical protein